MQIAVTLICGAILIAGCWIFYSGIVSTDWSDTERRMLSNRNLHLGHLLELMESSEVEVMSGDPQYKDTLLGNLVTFLLEDVHWLRKLRLGLMGRCCVGLFYAGYLFVKTKSLLGLARRRDFFFLAGLELGITRRVHAFTGTLGEELPMAPQKQFTVGVGTLGLVLTLFSLLSVTAYAYHLDQLRELKKTVNMYQVVLDAVLASTAVTTAETKEELTKLKAQHPEIVKDPHVLELVGALVAFKGDASEANRDRLQAATQAFRAAHGIDQE